MQRLGPGEMFCLYEAFNVAIATSFDVEVRAIVDAACESCADEPWGFQQWSFVLSTACLVRRNFHHHLLSMITIRRKGTSWK